MKWKNGNEDGDNSEMFMFATVKKNTLNWTEMENGNKITITTLPITHKANKLVRSR